MTRRSIPKATKTAVLLKSRRRCCICFGLNRDLGLKPGQIAHLNQRNDDPNEDNLAYLCLEHHDEYDSRTSQRKGLVEAEVRAYRDELYARLAEVLSLPVHFGELRIPPQDPHAGVWIRVGSGTDTAELSLTPIADSPEGDARYAITGEALWGSHREYGPNIGETAFVGALRNGVIEVFEPRRGDEIHMIRLTFDGGVLSVDEDNELGLYGMNVSFRGTYERAR